MIVDAFKETLELGLEKPKQVVVRFSFSSLLILIFGPNPTIWDRGSLNAITLPRFS
jgi:hypothetical protein